jgi:ATP-dependent Clp protease protease subunit
LNTVITEKTPAGETSFDVFSKLANDRILFLSDFIDDRVATDIVATILFLDQQDPKRPISLYINSDGGDVRSVFMIFDVINLLQSPIHTVCLNCASFSSAILLAAGTKGKRFATKSSLICLGQLNNDMLSYSDLTTAKINFEVLKRDNKKIFETLAKLTGKTSARVHKDCERKMFLNAKQAKRYGLVDHVIEWNR